MAERAYKIGTGEAVDSTNDSTEITPGYISNEPWKDSATLDPFWRALRDNEYSLQGQFFIADGESFQARVETIDEKRSRIANGFGIIAVGTVIDIQGTVHHMAEGGYDEVATLLVPDNKGLQHPVLKNSYSFDSPIAKTFYDEEGKAIRCVLENGDIYVDEGEGGLWLQYEGRNDTYYWSPDDTTGYRV